MPPDVSDQHGRVEYPESVTAPLKSPVKKNRLRETSSVETSRGIHFS